MVTRWRILLSILLAAAFLPAAASDFFIRGGVGAFYGIYDPWFGCVPYRCYDFLQFRIELERDRRMQELRERATPPELRNYTPAGGPWGGARYIPPATPEANIQPAYRGVSQLRPEYQHSAQ